MAKKMSKMNCMQMTVGAEMFSVPHQTWLCSFACRQDRSPSSHWRKTGEERGRRVRRTVRREVKT